MGNGTRWLGRRLGAEGGLLERRAGRGYVRASARAGSWRRLRPVVVPLEERRLLSGDLHRHQHGR